MNYIMFMTSQGSEYQFDKNKNKSKRKKLSGGSEQGKVFDWLNVVFIKDKVKLYAGPVSVNAYIFDKSLGTLNYFNNDGFDEFDGVNRVLVVAERRRESGEIVSMQRAFQRPEVGLFPFEWGKHKGKNIKHLGNVISKVDINSENKIHENTLRNIIRSLICESSGNSDYYGDEVSLNLGDVISIDREDTYIKMFNKDVDMMSLIGVEFKVINLHIQIGDEAENPMLYCEVEDDISGESIKYIPCYSNAISVVSRSEQMNDLNVGDLLYVLDIDENYFKVKNVQEKLGTSYRIVKLQKHKYFADTRYAFVVPEGAGDEDYSEMLIVPLVEGYVERV